MVGPSLSEEERRHASLRLKAGFVLLVGASSGLVALGSGGTPTQLALAVAGGLTVGAVLLGLLVRMHREIGADNRRRS